MRHLPHNLIISLRRHAAISDVQERDYAALGDFYCTRVFWNTIVNSSSSSCSPFLQLLTPDVTDSFDFRHASFRSRSEFPFGLAALMHFLRVLVHAGLLKIEFIFGS